MADKVTFTVMDSKQGKTFATLEEATAYEREHRKKTGAFVGIVAGTKSVTHTCKTVATETPKAKAPCKSKATTKKTTAKATPKKTTAKPKAKPKAPAKPKATPKRTAKKKK